VTRRIGADFFDNGTQQQFSWVLAKYPEAIQAKADSKPENTGKNLLKLDKWYQTELPKKIKSRGKDCHVTHEELVQTIKWKMARGVSKQQLKNLIQMNTPRVVMDESKKAFRAIFKRKDLESAMGALSKLKGVGPAMASAVLAAGCPEMAPYMADEVLLSMEETEELDYTMKEYWKLVAKVQRCVDRLNQQGGSWTPHQVELAVWTHYVAQELKPELLDEMPGRRRNKSDFEKDIEKSEETVANGHEEEEENDSEQHLQNGNGAMTEHNCKVATNGTANGDGDAYADTNEDKKILNGDAENCKTKRALEGGDVADETSPETKRMRTEFGEQGITTSED